MKQTVKPVRERDDVIETWKLDLERILWSYHENGRPDGRTGVIGNPKTIQEFVQEQMNVAYKQGKQDGIGYDSHLEDKIREKIGQCQQPRDRSCEYCSALHDVLSLIKDSNL